MLFNSHLFVFAFLPFTLAGFVGLRRISGQPGALTWLLLMSLVFYGWWNPRYLPLILGSIAFNYTSGLGLGKFRNRWVLAAGICANIGALVWFKYAGLLVETANTLAGSDYHLQTIILPLAVSFFTFQQISYLVDIYRGEAPERDLLAYAVFVAFFPQLIAGPIVKNSEMVPQFRRVTLGNFNHEYFAIGLALFLCGLFEKVVLADGVAVYASPVFEAAEQGLPISFFESWGGLLAYTFQIYFDFSGYSTMAIGLGQMFGVKLPVNFDTPYQARSIIDFWRRWHMTLSRFLKCYVYIPLGGNRKGRARQYLSLMATLVLGGIWHGAGWNFALWGGVHGLFLVANVVWRRWRREHRVRFPITKFEDFGGWALTFTLVVLARVFFRTDSLSAAGSLLRGAFGQNGFVLDERLAGLMGWLEPVVQFEGTHAGYFNLYGVPWLVVLGLICVLAPSPVELFGRFRPGLEIGTEFFSRQRRFAVDWQPSVAWAIAVVVVGVVAVVHMARVSEFIYYQF
ncbi:MAG: MBOAT family O-acyltransferase [Candidatus Krumholzibacteria bacterium]|nr:MBOAT family O-acyltransferase [Candidatus Krumholzibacteria bacterium]